MEINTIPLHFQSTETLDKKCEKSSFHIFYYKFLWWNKLFFKKKKVMTFYWAEISFNLDVLLAYHHEQLVQHRDYFVLYTADKGESLSASTVIGFLHLNPLLPCFAHSINNDSHVRWWVIQDNVQLFIVTFSKYVDFVYVVSLHKKIEKISWHLFCQWHQAMKLLLHVRP